MEALQFFHQWLGRFMGSIPNSKPFVSVGDEIKEGQTLCVVEAMKLMNEIPSDKSGVIREVLVENGQPVEYGQILFRMN